MGSSRVDPLFLSYPLFFGECLLPTSRSIYTELCRKIPEAMHLNIDITDNVY